MCLDFCQVGSGQVEQSKYIFMSGRNDPWKKKNWVLLTPLTPSKSLHESELRVADRADCNQRIISEEAKTVTSFYFAKRDAINFRAVVL